MKPVTVYEARDGARFNESAKAEEHERYLDARDHALEPLGAAAHDPRCKFANGKGFITHTREAVLEAKARWARTVADFGKDPRDIPNRLYSIDGRGREWGQPYFANHPEDRCAVHEEWTDREPEKETA